jgi:hypothetical protein
MVDANRVVRDVGDADDQSGVGVREVATEAEVRHAGHADRLPHVEQHRCDAEQERGATHEPGSLGEWVAVVGNHGSGRTSAGSGTVTGGTGGTA